MSGFQGRGAFVREGRLIQTCQLRGALIRKEAFIRERAFIRSFTVFNIFSQTNLHQNKKKSMQSFNFKFLRLLILPCPLL